MEVHNTVEDIVIARVDEIFETLGKEENAGKFCTCNQCRMDTICYILNRITPHYIISNRGASRVQRDSFEWQQQVADITALIHDGLRRVNHAQRPNFAHSVAGSGDNHPSNVPVFNIPTIMGRLFNGNNFAPIADVDIKLLCNGELVAMKDGNWQNPCRIVPNTEGAFSFWPAPPAASEIDEPAVFEYSLRVSVPEYEPLSHVFKISVSSESQAVQSFALARTFKLPDLYMFPPGDEQDEFQD